MQRARGRTADNDQRQPPVAWSSYGRIGQLEVRLASAAAEIAAAQRLRYEVFYEEMRSEPCQAAGSLRLDRDRYDEICDHLIVTTLDLGGDEARIVGTYRLLRAEVAERLHLPLYTSGEFDLGPLSRGPAAGLRILELGRSCVAATHRDRRTLEALWHGIWTYVREHRIDVMLGCASFPGADPDLHALPLTYLARRHLAPPGWRCKALPELHVPLDRLPGAPIDERRAIRGMPPLIKGYLRLGAFVGDGAVIDRAFGTTDVLIVLPVAGIDPRYFGRFGAPEERRSRLDHS